MQAIKAAFEKEGYGRRIAKRKGFSDDPRVKADRLAFTKEGVTWSRERVRKQMFSNVVWASSGAHTQSYITIKADGSDRYNPECVQHKYSKLPAWMFHGVIYDRKKGLACFGRRSGGA